MRLSLVDLTFVEHSMAIQMRAQKRRKELAADEGTHRKLARRLGSGVGVVDRLLGWAAWHADGVGQLCRYPITCNAIVPIIYIISTGMHNEYDSSPLGIR